MPAFLFQKGLSFPHRRSFLKRDKDLYYIFKVVETVNPEYLIASLDTVFKAHPPNKRREREKHGMMALAISAMNGPKGPRRQ
jgi:hypothetical protein